MALISLDRHSSMVLAVDIQARFLDSVWESDRVIGRSAYLVEVAKSLEVPVIATTQNANRLGPLHPNISIVDAAHDKMSFSCWSDEEIQKNIRRLDRRQIVIVGVETHICVGLTANDLILNGYEVVVCPDAVSSSTVDRHKLGMERIRDAGAVPAHTEGVAYEWVADADSSEFKELLRLTKRYH